MMVVVHVTVVQYIIIVRSDYKIGVLVAQFYCPYVVTLFVNKCTSRIQPVINGVCKVTATNESRED